MTFPASDRVIFYKNPLEEVICQLKFPTILEISAEEPVTFQNSIRDKYPLYESVQPGLPKGIGEIFPRLPIQVPQDVTHKFATPDGSKSISLASEFVAFADTKYERWERFLAEIERARQALEDAYRPAFYTRIGLRYKDVIDRESLGLEDVPWELLLKPPVLGLLGAQDGIREHVLAIATQTSISLDEVRAARATVRHGLGRRTRDNREAYIIDMDFYTEQRSESQDVSKILNEFNKLSGNFFRWAIADRLHDALEPRALSPNT